MTDFLFTNFPHFVFGFDRLDGVHDPVPAISGDSLNGDNALIYATLGCIFMWKCGCIFMWNCACIYMWMYKSVGVSAHQSSVDVWM